MSSTSNSLSTAEIEEALGYRIPVQTSKTNKPRSPDAVRKEIRKFREKLERANKASPCLDDTLQKGFVTMDQLAKAAARKGFRAYQKWGKQLCRKLEKERGLSKEQAEKVAKRSFAEEATKKVMLENNIVPLDVEQMESFSESYCSNPVSEKHYKRSNIDNLAKFLRNNREAKSKWALHKKGSSQSREKLCSAIAKTLMDLGITKDRAEADKVAEQLAGAPAAPASATAGDAQKTSPEARKDVVEAAKNIAVADKEQQKAVDKAAAGDKEGAKEAASKAGEAVERAKRASERAKSAGVSGETAAALDDAVQDKENNQTTIMGAVTGAVAGAIGGIFTRSRAAAPAPAAAQAAATAAEDLLGGDEGAEGEEVFVDASEEPASAPASDSVQTEEMMAALAFMEKFDNKKYDAAQCARPTNRGGKFSPDELKRIAVKLGLDPKQAQRATKPALCEYIRKKADAELARSGEPSVAEKAAAESGAIAPAGAAVVAAASESAGRKEYEEAIAYLKKAVPRYAGGQPTVVDAETCEKQSKFTKPKVEALAKLLGVDTANKTKPALCRDTFDKLSSSYSRDELYELIK